MHRISYAIASVMLATLNVACTYSAPTYVTAEKNVARLKELSPSETKVGTFSVLDGLPELSVRGHAVTSPYANSYGAYLAEALRQELAAAGHLSDKSGLEVSGQLLKNDITSFTDASVTVEARFVVRREETVKYDSVKSVKRPFPTAFEGGTAIPRAIYEYQFAIQDLLTALYADPDFAAAIK